jgi:hypothetical protein
LSPHSTIQFCFGTCQGPVSSGLPGKCWHWQPLPSKTKETKRRAGPCSLPPGLAAK